MQTHKVIAVGKHLGNLTNPRAAKKYSCSRCDLTISVGERYICASSREKKSDGHWYSSIVRFCETCYWQTGENECTDTE